LHCKKLVADGVNVDKEIDNANDVIYFLLLKVRSTCVPLAAGEYE